MGAIERVDVDDATLKRLEQLANLHGTTIEQEASTLLRQATAQRPSRAEIVARLRATAAMTPKGVPQTDSTLLVREDRDR